MLTQPIRLIVIAASAGGQEAVERVLSQLPADLPAAVAVALRTDEQAGWQTVEALKKHTALQVTYAEEGDYITHGRVYVAAPRNRLVVRAPGRLGVEPQRTAADVASAADALFISAASAHRADVIGVVLTGGGQDGSDGLIAVTGHGGRCLVQSPADAEVPGMPINAILRDSPDHIVLLEAIGPLLNDLVATEPPRS